MENPLWDQDNSEETKVVEKKYIKSLRVGI